MQQCELWTDHHDMHRPDDQVGGNRKRDGKGMYDDGDFGGNLMAAEQFSKYNEH
jgi:hypothetical protein